MAIPDLFNVEGLREGRNSQTFSRVSTAPELAASAGDRVDMIRSYSGQMEQLMEGAPERKVTYESTVKSLLDQLTTASTAYKTASNQYYQQAPALAKQLSNTPQKVIIGWGMKNWVPYPMYGTNPTWVSLNNQLSNLRTAQSARTTEYNTNVANTRTQSEAAFETYAGAPTRLAAEFETKQKELDPQGYLAYEGVQEDAVSPATTGEQLAETDLYSDTLAAEMLGKKKEVQAAPEEDILSGVMQSSLYRG